MRHRRRLRRVARNSHRAVNVHDHPPRGTIHGQASYRAIQGHIHLAAIVSGRGRRRGPGAVDRAAPRAGRGRLSAPSERVNVAGIGAGGMGGGDIANHAKNGANIVALVRRRRPARPPARSTRFRKPSATRIFASCSTRRPRTSMRSPSARPITFTPWPRWPRSAPASTSIARSRSRTRCTNAAS